MEFNIRKQRIPIWRITIAVFILTAFITMFILLFKSLFLQIIFIYNLRSYMFILFNKHIMDSEKHKYIYNKIVVIIIRGVELCKSLKNLLNKRKFHLIIMLIV